MLKAKAYFEQSKVVIPQTLDYRMFHTLSYKKGYIFIKILSDFNGLNREEVIVQFAGFRWPVKSVHAGKLLITKLMKFELK